MTPLTAYSACILVACDAIATLNILLDKAQASPNADSLPNARIHESMEPLTFQVRTACDTVDKLVSRTMGTPRAGWHDDKLVGYKDMRQRLGAARRLLDAVDTDAFNVRANGILSLPSEQGGTEDTWAHVYITSFNLPNLFFHVVTAYNILRAHGVPLGKTDYLYAFGERMQAGTIAR